MVKLVSTIKSDDLYSVLGVCCYSISDDLSAKHLPSSSLGLFHIAAFYDSLECFLFLLAQGFSPEMPTPHEYRPLHFAAAGGASEVSSFLIRECGVDPHTRPPHGHSALYFAVLAHSASVVRILLSAAGGKAFPDHGEVVSRALLESDGECLALVLLRGFSGAAHSDTASPLMRAAFCGFADAIEYLVAHGCDPNYVAVDGNCALRVACLAGSPATVVALLRAGADPNIVGVAGQTVVHWAAMSGSTQIVRAVLAAGARAEAICAAGMPAWVYAIGAKEKKEIVGALITAGAPVNTRSRNPETMPIVRAIAVDDPELMETLIKSGIDLDVEVKGVAVRELALQIAAPRVRAVIKKHTKSGDSGEG
jgi:ankyrin repeat protein